MEWHNVLDNVLNLEKLQLIFKQKCDANGSELGLTKNELAKAISILDGNVPDTQVNNLFEEIHQNTRETIKWNDFLDYLIKHIHSDSNRKLTVNLSSIESVPHAKNETIVKIVLIETEQYFCYAVILKHGRVGLYDGNMNFLSSYHAIMTREDITRPETERRRRNRWVTDAIFCPDTMMLLITNSARTIIIYEASGLQHVPYWLIISTPNIIESLSYKPFVKVEGTGYSDGILFMGDSNGELMSFNFHKPKNELLPRKRSDNITVLYWNEFINKNRHVSVKRYGKIHADSVKRVHFCAEKNLLITCSEDRKASIIIKHVDRKRDTVFCKVQNGVTCFALSSLSKVLITGSSDGILRLWNMFIVKPIAILHGHESDIVDIQIIENIAVFISCSCDGVLKLWDLNEQICTQTIKINFPSFRVQGKLIEWGKNCIYPGPKRKEPGEISAEKNMPECFSISDVIEMKPNLTDSRKRLGIDRWERSCLFVTCCNYLATLRTSFLDASIEFGFTYPILPPPPLQNSVLVPSDWGLQREDNIKIDRFKEKLHLDEEPNNLHFILDRSLLEEETKSDINYKIAILESKKEKMRSKVALGSPYLALDLNTIQEVKMSEDLSINRGEKAEYYIRKINKLLENAAYKDEIFSSPEPSSSRSKSSKSSIVDLPY